MSIIAKTRSFTISQKNQPCTQTEVINYMLKKKLSSLVTTHRIIKELEASKIITVIPDEKNRQTQRLSINDKNPYNRYIEEINTISKAVLELAKDIEQSKEVLSSSADSNSRDILTYLQWLQYEIFLRIAAISVSAELLVKSKEDQQDLYLRLNKVMRNCYELDKKTLPSIIKVMKESAVKKIKFEPGSKEANLLNSLGRTEGILHTLSSPTILES